jgi:predicted  nucleic acid-binding Zn-ribbon protein
MTDNVTNELLLEHLKRIQSDLLDLKSMRTETREGFASIRQHFAALNNDHTLLEYRLLALESEMERVRRRLDIQE